MGLREDIEAIKEELKNKPKSKREILEAYRAEICEMIELKISLKKQIELIIKNNILEKLEYREYYFILKKHFGLVASEKKKKTQTPTSTNKQDTKKPVTPFDAVKELSKDFDLLTLANK